MWNKTLIIFRTGSNPNLHGPTDFSDPQYATAPCNFANALYIYFQHTDRLVKPRGDMQLWVVSVMGWICGLVEEFDIRLAD